jgi:sulfur carrier protein ThiS
MTSEAEDRYFRKRDQELREKHRAALEKAAREAKRRREIADQIGTSDDAIIDHVKTLGLDGDTVRVLDLFPVIAVAWADDDIQSGERIEIMRVLEERGISEDSEAWHLVASLLETRPTRTFINEVIEILRAIHANQGGVAENLVDLCYAVANASASMFGLGPKVASQELDWIERIAHSMGEDAEAELNEILGSGSD